MGRDKKKGKIEEKKIIRKPYRGTNKTVEWEEDI